MAVVFVLTPHHKLLKICSLCHSACGSQEEEHSVRSPSQLTRKFQKNNLFVRELSSMTRSFHQITLTHISFFEFVSQQGLPSWSPHVYMSSRFSIKKLSDKVGEVGDREARRVSAYPCLVKTRGRKKPSQAHGSSSLISRVECMANKTFSCNGPEESVHL